MNGVIRLAVCFFCHDGSGRYLISRRTRNARDEWETWDPGGGGIKFGERVEDALHRELLEEYCTSARTFEFMGYRDVMRIQDGKETHWITFDFKVHVDPETIQIGEPKKCDALRWVTIEELQNLEEPVHSQFPSFLEKNRNYLQ